MKQPFGRQLAVIGQLADTHEYIVARIYADEACFALVADRDGLSRRESMAPGSRWERSVGRVLLIHFAPRMSLRGTAFASLGLVGMGVSVVFEIRRNRSGGSGLC